MYYRRRPQGQPNSPYQFYAGNFFFSRPRRRAQWCKKTGIRSLCSFFVGSGKKKKACGREVVNTISGQRNRRSFVERKINGLLATHGITDRLPARGRVVEAQPQSPRSHQTVKLCFNATVVLSSPGSQYCGPTTEPCLENLPHPRAVFPSGANPFRHPGQGAITGFGTVPILAPRYCLWRGTRLANFAALQTQGLVLCSATARPFARTLSARCLQSSGTGMGGAKNGTTTFHSAGLPGPIRPAANGSRTGRDPDISLRTAG